MCVFFTVLFAQSSNKWQFCLLFQYRVHVVVTNNRNGHFDNNYNNYGIMLNKAVLSSLLLSVVELVEVEWVTVLCDYTVWW
jgi:hypothetical protein